MLIVSARRVTAQNAPARAVASATTRPAQSATRELVVDVIDSKTRQPVTGAEIRPYISDDEHPVATTDAKGRGTIHFSAGTTSMNLWVRKAGYASTVTVFGNRSPIPTHYTMPIERGMKVGGIVVDENGKPIAGATVALWARLPQESSRYGLPHPEVYDVKVRTDTDGKWSSDIIPPDAQSVALRLSDPDFVSDDLYGKSSTPSIEELRSLSARSVMKKGIQVSGRVVDESDKPIADAIVSLGGRTVGQHPPTIQSGADGTFDLAHCAVGTHAPLIVTAKNHAPWMQTVSADGPRSGIKVVLAPPRPLHVRVVDVQGKPLANSRILLQHWNRIDALWWDAYTDADGMATWTEAPLEGATYDISHAGHIQLTDRPLQGGPDLQTVALNPVIKVNGSVVDEADGKPIRHFKIVKGWMSGSNRIFWEENTREPTMYGADGKFELTEDLNRDGYAVRIDADGYLPAESQVFHPGDAMVALSFHLKRAADLEGTLVKSDGTPLANANLLMVTPGCQIFLQDGKVGSQTFVPIERSDANGHFDLPPQDGKFYLMVVSDEAYALLRPDQLGKSKRIVIPAWGRIEGKALIGKGPASGHGIEAYESIPVEGDRTDRMDNDFMGVNMTNAAAADENGHFMLLHVPPGDATVGIKVEWREAADRRGMTSGTQRTHVQVQAGKIANLVLGGEGRPIIGRVITPPDLADQLDWYSGRFEIRTRLHLPGRALPPDWKTMTEQQKSAWNDQWRKNPDVVAYEKELANRKYYPVVVRPDGTFRVDDVVAGQYILYIEPYMPPGINGRVITHGIASASLEFTVPKMSTGRSDEPLDIGAVLLKPKKGLPASQAPALSAKTVDGKPLSLAQFKGKYVLVDFWATWCTPCVAEMPYLKATYDAFSSDPRFAMISLSVDEKPEAPAQFAANQGLKWTQGFLGDWSSNDVAAQWDVHAIPSVFLISPDGKIIDRDLRGDAIKRRVAEALGTR